MRHMKIAVAIHAQCYTTSLPALRAWLTHRSAYSCHSWRATASLLCNSRWLPCGGGPCAATRIVCVTAFGFVLCSEGHKFTQSPSPSASSSTMPPNPRTFVHLTTKRLFHLHRLTGIRHRHCRRRAKKWNIKVRRGEASGSNNGRKRIRPFRHSTIMRYSTRLAIVMFDIFAIVYFAYNGKAALRMCDKRVESWMV